MRLEEAVSELLQDKLNNRLYPFILPQKCAFPAVAYTPISISRVHSMQEDTGFVKQHMQFSCYAKSYKEAINVATIIRKQLQNLSGTVGGLFIGAVLVVGEMTDYESNTGLYSVMIEFEFQFKEE